KARATTTRSPARRHASSAASSAPALLAAYGEVGATGSVSRRGRWSAQTPYTSPVETTRTTGSARPARFAWASTWTTRAVPAAFTVQAKPESRAAPTSGPRTRRRRSRAPSRQSLQVGIDHHAHQLGERRARRPPELAPCLARIGVQGVHLRGSHETRVHGDILLPLEAHMREGQL